MTREELLRLMSAANVLSGDQLVQIRSMPDSVDAYYDINSVETAPDGLIIRATPPQPRGMTRDGLTVALRRSLHRSAQVRVRLPGERQLQEIYAAYTLLVVAGHPLAVVCAPPLRRQLPLRSRRQGDR